MKFQLNQELTLKNDKIKIKVTGLRNGSQPVIISGSGENYYDIEVEGFRSCISEPMLDLLMKEVVISKPVEVHKIEVKIDKDAEIAKKRLEDVNDKVVKRPSRSKRSLLERITGKSKKRVR
jgi:hypothetical protein